MEDLGYICCGTVGYALYVQFSPRMGNVWYRIDSTGEKSLNISSLINIMKETSINKEFWKFKNLDINYPFFTVSCWGLLKGVGSIIL